jgi:hypothetical protein
LIQKYVLSVKKLLDYIKYCQSIEIARALSEKVAVYKNVYMKRKAKKGASLLEDDFHLELHDLQPLFSEQFRVEEGRSSWSHMFSRGASNDLISQYAILFNQDYLTRQAVNCLIFQELGAIPRGDWSHLINAFHSIIDSGDASRVSYAKELLDVLPWKENIDFLGIKAELDSKLQTMKVEAVASVEKTPTAITNAPVESFSEQALKGLFKFTVAAVGKPHLTVPSETRSREIVRELQQNGHGDRSEKTGSSLNISLL